MRHFLLRRGLRRLWRSPPLLACGGASDRQPRGHRLHVGLGGRRPHLRRHARRCRRVLGAERTRAGPRIARDRSRRSPPAGSTTARSPQGGAAECWGANANGEVRRPRRSLRAGGGRLDAHLRVDDRRRRRLLGPQRRRAGGGSTGAVHRTHDERRPRELRPDPRRRRGLLGSQQRRARRRSPRPVRAGLGRRRPQLRAHHERCRRLLGPARRRPVE